MPAGATTPTQVRREAPCARLPIPETSRRGASPASRRRAQRRPLQRCRPAGRAPPPAAAMSAAAPKPGCSMRVQRAGVVRNAFAPEDAHAAYASEALNRRWRREEYEFQR